MPNNLLIEGPEQGVQILTLNRPEALNTLNTELLASTTGRQAGLDAFIEKRKPQFTGR